MDDKSDFYFNFPKDKTVMTAGDYEHRRLARSRASEVGVREDTFTPSLAQTFFGPGSRPVSVPNFGSVSIKQQRTAEKSFGDSRALELGKRRKITSASEKFKFF